MTIPAITECQKAILWLMYFWQHRGFTQIARPPADSFEMQLEVDRYGIDATGRPLGALGFGRMVLQDEHGLMRTIWLWRYSTDATRLSSVDLPLIAVPLHDRYSDSEILDSIRALRDVDGLLTQSSGSPDGTKIRSVLIGPNLTISAGVPTRYVKQRGVELMPGLAYWLSDEASVARQLREDEFEPWTAFDGKTYRGSQSSETLSRLIAIHSNHGQVVPPPCEVAIPRRGTLVPMSSFRIACGNCAKLLEPRFPLRLDLDRCPKCQESIGLCSTGLNSMKCMPEPLADSALVCATALQLTENGYRAARHLVEEAHFSPFGLSAQCVPELENLGSRLLYECLERLAEKGDCDQTHLPGGLSLDVLQTFAMRNWIQLPESADSSSALPRSVRAMAAVANLGKGYVIRLSEIGRKALAQLRQLREQQELEQRPRLPTAAEIQAANRGHFDRKASLAHIEHEIREDLRLSPGRVELMEILTPRYLAERYKNDPAKLDLARADAARHARSFPRFGGQPESHFRHKTTLIHPPNAGLWWDPTELQDVLRDLRDRGVIELVKADDAGEFYGLDGREQRAPTWGLVKPAPAAELAREEWKPEPGMVSVKTIMADARFRKHRKNPSRTTIQQWTERHQGNPPLRKQYAPDTNELYLPESWVHEQIALWNPRT